MGGDCNINLLRYGSNNIVSKFVDTVYASCLLPSIFLPNRVTKQSSTLIDNIFVNHSSLKLNGVVRFDISDHCPVFVILPQLVQFDIGDYCPVFVILPQLVQFDDAHN